jgi:hypothetical protein
MVMIIDIILFGYVIPTLLSIIIKFCAGLTSNFNDSFYSHEITYKLCCTPIMNICIVLFTIVILLSGLYFKIEDIISWCYNNFLKLQIKEIWMKL